MLFRHQLTEATEAVDRALDRLEPGPGLDDLRSRFEDIKASIAAYAAEPATKQAA